jgi:hypothetical protein
VLYERAIARHGDWPPVSPLHLSAVSKPLPEISEVLLEAGAASNATGGNLAETPMNSAWAHHNNEAVKAVLAR